MTLSRRDFIKVSAGSAFLLASRAAPVPAAPSKTLPSAAVGMLYDSTLCIGCKSCMVNCKKFNSMPGGALYTEGRGIPYEFNTPERIYDAPRDLSDKTLTIIKTHSNGTGLNKDRAANGFSFIKQNCLHCVDPVCVSVCPVAALHKKSDTGVVAYDKKKCIGCRYCQMACPFGIPRFEWGSTSPSIVKCQLCQHRYGEGGYAACCEFCPTGASIFGKVTALREEADRRLGLKSGIYYDYPQQRADSSRTSRQTVAAYVDRVYGRTEAGGTQNLFLAGVPFDLLGFNPAITDSAYPEETWKYISKVPWLIGLLLVAGTTTHYLTGRKPQE